MNSKPKCWLCDNENIINEHCTKCNKAFCMECASRWDYKYCDECMRDVSVTTGIMDGKANIEWDENSGETTVVRGHKCKVIQFQGIDWMFLMHRIHNISDKELIEEIAVHRAIVSAMASELSSRTVNNLHTTQPPKPPKQPKAAKLAAKRPMKTPEQILVEKLMQWASTKGFTTSEEAQAFLEGIGKK